MQLDHKHENAIRWGFEKQNADFIAEALKAARGDASVSSIYSSYMTYRDEMAERPLRLSVLLVNYNKAKDQRMAQRVLSAAKSAGVDYEKLQPAFLKREPV